MVICRRQELDKDLSDNTDAWFLLITDRDQVKLMYHLMAHLLELAVADTASCQEGNNSLLPDFMFTIDNSVFQFIRTHTVNAFHQDVSKDRTIADAFDQWKGQLEARIAFQSAQVDGNNRNLLHAGFLKCTADKRDIVRCTTSTTCL